MTQFTYDDLLRVVQSAQRDQWRQLEEGDEPVAFRTDLNTHELLAWIMETDPTEGFTHCQRCRDAILTWGNVVYVQVDGTLDSALFPTTTHECNEDTPWVTWYRGLTQYLLHQPNGSVRPVVSTLLRGTDGATYPKYTRGKPQPHLNVKYTPRRPETTRTLIKRNARIIDRTDLLMGLMCLTPMAIEHALSLHMVDYYLTDRCVERLLLLRDVQVYIDTAENSRLRRNIYMAACAQSSSYLDIPEDFIVTLDIFGATRDKNDLTALEGLNMITGGTHVTGD